MPERECQDGSLWTVALLMQARGWECKEEQGDGSIGMGVLGCEHGDGSMGQQHEIESMQMGVWGWELVDGSVMTYMGRLEPSFPNHFEFLLTIYLFCFSASLKKSE